MVIRFFFTHRTNEYVFIEFSKLADYFDVNSDSAKVNIFDCKQLHLCAVDYEQMQAAGSLRFERYKSKRSLADIETFDWLLAQGVDIRASSEILSAWVEKTENEKLVNYLKQFKTKNFVMREKDQDIVVKISDQNHYFLCVNENPLTFNSGNKKYIIIESSELFNYFDVNSDSGKINIFSCNQLHLRAINEERFLKKTSDRYIW